MQVTTDSKVQTKRERRGRWVWGVEGGGCLHVPSLLGEGRERASGVGGGREGVQSGDVRKEEMEEEPFFFFLRV